MCGLASLAHVDLSIPTNPSLVCSRKHFAGLVLPALPALCIALLWLTFVTTSLSNPFSASKYGCFTNPQSTTYDTFGSVIDVSAMLVAKIALRVSDLRWYGLGQ